jgi:hypothetical protein
MVVAAAAVLVAGGIEVGGSSIFRHPELRSEHAQPGAGVPPDMLVVVSTGGKIFHVRGCPFIHDKTHIRTITARQALREGYAPCLRCMRKYLHARLTSPLAPADRASLVPETNPTNYK